MTEHAELSQVEIAAVRRAVQDKLSDVTAQCEQYKRVADDAEKRMYDARRAWARVRDEYDRLQAWLDANPEEGAQ